MWDLKAKISQNIYLSSVAIKQFVILCILAAPSDRARKLSSVAVALKKPLTIIFQVRFDSETRRRRRRNPGFVRLVNNLEFLYTIER